MINAGSHIQRAKVIMKYQTRYSDSVQANDGRDRNIVTIVYDSSHVMVTITESPTKHLTFNYNILIYYYFNISSKNWGNNGISKLQ